MPLVLTDAGVTALQTARANGDAFEITAAQLGSGQYTPDGTETALSTPFSPAKSLVSSGQVVDVTTLYIEFQDQTADIYNVGEIGIFAGTTLFAIESQPVADGFLTAKPSADSFLIFSMMETLVNETTASITFTSTPTFPVGTDTISGKHRRATTTEVADRDGTGVVVAERLPLPTVRPVAASGVGGTANAVTLTLDPVETAYAEGRSFLFVAKSNNTGPLTVDVDGLGAKVVYISGAAAAAGDVDRNTLYLITYNGTRFNVAGAASADMFSVADIADELDALADNDRIVVGDASASNDAKYITKSNLRDDLDISTAFDLYEDVLTENTSIAGADRLLMSDVSAFGQPNEFATVSALATYVRSIGGFDLHDDVSTENTSLADADRILVSDESISGDPNEWSPLSRLASYVLGKFNLHDDVALANSSPADADRIFTSDESASGDPNAYTTFSQTAAYVRDEVKASDVQARAGNSDDVLITAGNLGHLGWNVRLFTRAESDSEPSNPATGDIDLVFED